MAIAKDTKKVLHAIVDRLGETNADLHALIEGEEPEDETPTEGEAAK